MRRAIQISPSLAILCNELAEARSQFFEARMPQVKLNSSPMERPAAKTGCGLFQFARAVKEPAALLR